MELLLLEDIVRVGLVSVHDVNNVVHEQQTQEENHLFATGMRSLRFVELNSIRVCIRSAHHYITMVVIYFMHDVLGLLMSFHTVVPEPCPSRI